MSHFSVMVVTDNGTQEEVTAALQPYHEYESTGVRDQHVVFEDHHDEVMQEWGVKREAAFQGPDGKLYDGYEPDIFYREPTVEEANKMGVFAGSGYVGDFSYHSQDWGDGLGYRPKVRFVPEGFVETTRSLAQAYESPEVYAEEYHGYDVVCNGRIGRYTNSNKYDWYIDAQKIATTIGQTCLPFLQKESTCGGEFLLDATRRLVYILQGLRSIQKSDTNNRAAKTMAPEIYVWRHAGKIPEDAKIAERMLRDMQQYSSSENWWIRSGSLPQDGECSRGSLPFLQHFVGECHRRSVDFTTNFAVSGKTLRKQFVSGSKWDWWTVGGRWSDFLTLKTGRKTSYARKGDIDFASPKFRAEKDAAALYERARVIADGRTFLPWDLCRQKYPNIEEARDFYHTQAVVNELREQLNMSAFDSVERFLTPKEEFVRNAGDRSISTFAVLKDGVWAERGEMGWWGVVHDENDDWYKSFEGLLNTIPDDKMITIVDCHI